MYWLVIPAHAAALVAWAYCVKWEIKRNADLIKADGAMNSLHEGFHRLRSFYRIMAALLLATVASLPLWANDPAMGLSILALLAVFSGYFVWKFNPELSLARGLPADYVSEAKHGACFDRFIWWLTNTLHDGFALPGYVSWTFWMVLNTCLLIGAAAYVALMVSAVYLLAK